MNKKNMFFVTMMMVFATHSLLSISTNDQRKIRKDLYLKYDNSLLNAVQLTEPGLTLSEVLERDIQILDQHKDALQYKIKINKSGFGRSLAGGIVLGGINVGSAAIVQSEAQYINSLWNGDGDLSLKVSDGVVIIKSWLGIINEDQKNQHNLKKAKQLFKDYPELGSRFAIFVGASVVAIVSGLWCIKKVYNMFKFNPVSVSQYIAQCKKRIDRDQMIIAQLQQLKYDAGL